MSIDLVLDPSEITRSAWCRINPCVQLLWDFNPSSQFAKTDVTPTKSHALMDHRATYGKTYDSRGIPLSILPHLCASYTRGNHVVLTRIALLSSDSLMVHNFTAPAKPQMRAIPLTSQ